MARYNDNPGIFDVSRPNRTNADPTGRPIIAGHQPMMTDPMVREGHQPKITNVPVTSIEPTSDSPGVISPNMSQSSTYTSLESLIDDGHPNPPAPDGAGGDKDHLLNSMPLSHPSGAGPRSFWRSPLILIISLLVVLFAAYAALDALTNISLPFHLFRKKEPVAQVQNTAPPKAVQSADSLPAGFAKFNLSGTSLSFGYPTLWGTPSATAEPGFSKRGGTNKSDGTYAYLINFATNKDVQVAITSAKYLPAARTPLYYDYLQWCVGTSDSKFYRSILHSATVDKVDTPTTITCDQGPLADAAKQDDTIIVQAKTKDSDGKTVLGDVYTKNLTATDLPVLRVKDVTMTNSTNIKSLLSTVKVSSSANQTP